MRSLLKFFSITYIVSWSLWIVAAAVSPMTHPQPSGLLAIRGVLYLIGVFAPSLVALALTAEENGRARTLALLSRTIKWSVGVQWYVFALGFMVVIKLTAALLLRITTGSWPTFGGESAYIMAIAIPFSTPLQAGEEIGWRGYALPRLSEILGLPSASIVLGVIWAA